MTIREILRTSTDAAGARFPGVLCRSAGLAILLSATTTIAVGAQTTAAKSDSESSAAVAAPTETSPETLSDSPIDARVESLDRGYWRRGGWNIGFYGYPWFSWGWGGWGWPYWGWDGPWVGGGFWNPDAGAVDLNIKPKSAEVFVDGAYVGRVDQFDGFPRYLWLERGTRNLVVYKPGFQTLARRIGVRPGQILNLRERMVAGEAKTPEELFAQLDPEPAEVVEEEETIPRPPLPRSRQSRPREADEDWRERRPPPPTSSVQVDQRSPPGRVQIAVTPPDAAVYLDGRLLGSGEELSRLHHGLMVDAGTHQLEVVRPGYEAALQEFEIAADDDLQIEVTLRADGP